MDMRHILILVALALPAACVTDKPEGPEGAERTHYTLKEGQKIKYPKPLPDRTDIAVEWHYSNGATTTSDGFRGWDLNGDDRYEMVEVLNDDGTTRAYVYDFDGDGKVDLVKDKVPDTKK
jgi:hypothetical protein